jgi:hypothetical protein
MGAMICDVPRNLEQHPIAGQAEVIPFISPSNESACAMCGGTGWRHVEGVSQGGYRRCGCIAAVKDWGSPRLAAVKLLFDELFPLAVCNTISVSLDAPSFHLAVVCVNPHREVFLRLSDEGKVVCRWACAGVVKDANFELVDPRCSVRVLDWVLGLDEDLFRSQVAGLGLAVDRFGDLRRRIGVYVGGENG